MLCLEPTYNQALYKHSNETTRKTIYGWKKIGFVGSCNENDGISPSAIAKAASKAVGFLPAKLRLG